jgi:acetyl esterase/lipase
LWDGSAPGAKGQTDADIPRIDVYLPAENPTRTGVLVCPGGGYHYLAMSNEGWPIAVWLNAHGVAAFVLHYRVKPYGYPAPLLDGERAMRFLRSRAALFHLAPDHLGVWGFSAGGHVASALMTAFDAGDPSAADVIDRVSDRPDFGILAYSVISMDPSIAHPGSRENLLGKNPSPELERQYSNELHVSPHSPPAFLFATSDDATVPVANSLSFYQAYIALKLPIEMHLFEHGRHGAGLAVGLPTLDQWPNLLANWMASHGWMQPQPAGEATSSGGASFRN